MWQRNSKFCGGHNGHLHHAPPTHQGAENGDVDNVRLLALMGNGTGGRMASAGGEGSEFLKPRIFAPAAAIALELEAVALLNEELRDPRVLDVEAVAVLWPDVCETGLPEYSSMGSAPVPGARGGGCSEPSALALKFRRYHSAAFVAYLSAIGRFSGTPCCRMKSRNLRLPPSSIILTWMGFQVSIFNDLTKLKCVPSPRWTPAALMEM